MDCKIQHDKYIQMSTNKPSIGPVLLHIFYNKQYPYMLLTNISLYLRLQFLLYFNHFSCILFYILYILEVEHDIIAKGLKKQEVTTCELYALPNTFCHKKSLFYRKQAKSYFKLEPYT